MERSIAPALPLIRLPESLDDGTLLLNVHRVEDAEAHLEGEDEEMRSRFDAVRPATLEETRRAMRRWIEGRRTGAPMFAYAIRQRSGRLIGGCELRMRSPVSANVSYWIFPQFRRRGYALRALSVLCEAASSVDELERLEARVAPDNVASRRVLDKANFVESGTVEEIAWTGKASMMLLYVRFIVGPSRPRPATRARRARRP
jgi:RimJ/RimL family protein N-acetyltransferase